jgi:hypothetical protein
VGQRFPGSHGGGCADAINAAEGEQTAQRLFHLHEHAPLFLCVAIFLPPVRWIENLMAHLNWRQRRRCTQQLVPCGEAASV